VKEEQSKVFDVAQVLVLTLSRSPCVLGKGTYKEKKSGKVYEGEWQFDCRCGHGTLSVPDNKGGMRKLYAGGWLDDKWHGYGTYFYPDDLASYQGNWDRGVKSGWGTMTYKDGSKYNGEWHNDHRHGQGVLHLSESSCRTV
jgi:hypothetical protein